MSSLPNIMPESSPATDAEDSSQNSQAEPNAAGSSSVSDNPTNANAIQTKNEAVDGQLGDVFDRMTGVEPQKTGDSNAGQSGEAGNARDRRTSESGGEDGATDDPQESTTGDPASPGETNSDGSEASDASDAAKNFLSLYPKVKTNGMSEQEVAAEAKERARESLKLYQWQDSSINGLPDQELFRVAHKARSGQMWAQEKAAGEERLQKLVDDALVARGVDPVQADGYEQNTEGDVSPNGDPLSLDQAHEAALQSLGDSSLYDDLPDHLKPVFDAQGSEMAQLREANDRLLDQADEMLYQNTAMRLVQAGQLGSQMNDPDNLDKVYDRVIDLSRGDVYYKENGKFDWVNATKVAYGIEFGAENQSKHENDLTTRHDQQISGVPSGGNTSGSSSTERPPAAMDADGQMNYILDQMTKGVSGEEARLKNMSRGR